MTVAPNKWTLSHPELSKARNNNTKIFVTVYRVKSLELSRGWQSVYIWEWEIGYAAATIVS